MLIARRKADQNRAAIDPWTGVHAGAGLAAGLMGAPFWPSMAAAVAYEIVEQYVERTGVGQRFFKTSGPENTANVIVDLIVFGAGHWAGQKWNES